MEVKTVDIYSEDAMLLIDELNQALIALIGNAGTKHVNLDDFIQQQSAFFIGYENETPVCCAGIRSFSPGIGEIKRVYARKNHHGFGG